MNTYLLRTAFMENFFFPKRIHLKEIKQFFCILFDLFYLFLFSIFQHWCWWNYLFGSLRKKVQMPCELLARIRSDNEKTCEMSTSLQSANLFKNLLDHVLFLVLFEKISILHFNWNELKESDFFLDICCHTSVKTNSNWHFTYKL